MLNHEKGFIREVLKHWNDSSFIGVFRHYFKWKESLDADFSLINEQLPWINYEAIDFLSEFISEQSRVFEYGGGASTLYFLNKGARVYTVEHDDKWLDILRNRVERGKFSSQWTAIQVRPEPSSIPFHQSLVFDPNLYFSLDSQFSGFNFRRYASSIDEHENGWFDLVVIDGRARPSCIKHAVKKVRIGGCLIIDNTERDYYITGLTQPYLDCYKVILNKFGPSPCSQDFTRTTIFERER